MDAPGWLSRSAAEVPVTDDWLGDDERRALAAFGLERRRIDWRLGRFTAKAAVSASLAVPSADIQILAAADGAPEAWLDGVRAPVSVTLSHRGGRALAAVTRSPGLAGCDLELIEPRSGAFIREWLAPAEQRQVWHCSETERPLLANLIWTAKEAAAKVRREGLRLDVRRAVVTIGTDRTDPGWKPLQVEWELEKRSTGGWWRVQDTWVMVVAGDPPPRRPRALAIVDGAPVHQPPSGGGTRSRLSS